MRERRGQRGLTQTQLAILIQGKQPQIKDYELGKRVPNSDTLARIARALECSADYLLGLSDSPVEQMPLLRSNLMLLLSSLPQDELDKIERVINAMLSFDSSKDKPKNG